MLLPIFPKNLIFLGRSNLQRQKERLPDCKKCDFIAIPGPKFRLTKETLGPQSEHCLPMASTHDKFILVSACWLFLARKSPATFLQYYFCYVTRFLFSTLIEEMYSLSNSNKKIYRRVATLIQNWSIQFISQVTILNQSGWFIFE